MILIVEKESFSRSLGMRYLSDRFLSHHHHHRFLSLPLSALIGKRFHLPPILSYLRELRSALCRRSHWRPSPPLRRSPPPGKRPVSSAPLLPSYLSQALPPSLPPSPLSRSHHSPFLARGPAAQTSRLRAACTDLSRHLFPSSLLLSSLSSIPSHTHTLTEGESIKQNAPVNNLSLCSGEPEWGLSSRRIHSKSKATGCSAPAV